MLELLLALPFLSAALIALQPRLSRKRAAWLAALASRLKVSQPVCQDCMAWLIVSTTEKCGQSQPQ